MADDKNVFFLFTLDNKKYAMPLSYVERVLPAMEITAVPEHDECLLGVINLHGHVLPVVNLRRLLNMPDKELDITDQFVVATLSDYVVALVIDNAEGVVTFTAEQITPVKTIFPGIGHVTGVIPLSGEMTLIYDLNQFMSIDKRKELTAMTEQFMACREPSAETT